MSQKRALADWNQIIAMPQTSRELDPLAIDTHIHESLFRSYHVLAQARALLECGTSPDVVLHVINHLQGWYDG